MGTQQILMIVLSVVIVGIAVAVGITMFQNQAKNSNRQAVVADLQNFAASAAAFYKLPKNMAGGGNGNPGFANTNGELAAYLGFGDDLKLTNENGEYTITAPSQYSVSITGVGTEVGNNGSDKVGATVVITANSTTNAVTSEITIDN